jgi:predicted Zn finger-like uncharacterized protein
MNLQIACPHCQTRVRAPAQMVGQSVKCPSCQQTFVVIDPSTKAAPPAPAPSGGFEDLGEPDVSRKPARRKTNPFVDFLIFRLMIAPYVIQILFWLGVLACIGIGGFTVIGGFAAMLTKDFSGHYNILPGIVLILLGFAYMLFGPFVLRLYAELGILLFRVYDVLQEIRDRLDTR